MVDALHISVLPQLVQLIMLFVFKINLVIKLFVLVKIPCEVGTVILQRTNRRIQKQNYSKNHSLLSHYLMKMVHADAVFLFTHAIPCLCHTLVSIIQSKSFLIFLYISLLQAQTNILKVYFYFNSHLPAILNEEEVYFEYTFTFQV